MIIWAEEKIIGILVMFNYAHITLLKGKHRSTVCTMRR